METPMTQKDPRVDAYIAKAAPFAQPLLAWLRDTTHGACAELQEDIKWGMPFFVYQGKPVAHMAAFKQHCAFGLWRGRDVVDTGKEGEAMGQFGRITTQADLPGAREFKALIKTAVAKTAADIAAPPAPKPRTAKPLPEMPADLAAALSKKPKALKQFEAFAPTHRREYLEWVMEAKREETRGRRIIETVARLLDGQTRYDQRP
jgi:uncharacterized protein YdeI (YjbR/CyaY-like superfamily)